MAIGRPYKERICLSKSILSSLISSKVSSRVGDKAKAFGMTRENILDVMCSNVLIKSYWNKQSEKHEYYSEYHNKGYGNHKKDFEKLLHLLRIYNT